MPKNTHAHGPTYDGHADTAPHKSQPEWAEVAEVQVADVPESEAKPKRKSSTTAKAGGAAGKGATRS